MKKAIVVSYSYHRIAFIVEGFDTNEVNVDLIKKHVLSFFSKLVGSGNVTVEEVLNDFIVTTPTDVFTVSWSWYTSFAKDN